MIVVQRLVVDRAAWRDRTLRKVISGVVAQLPPMLRP